MPVQRPRFVPRTKGPGHVRGFTAVLPHERLNRVYSNDYELGTNGVTVTAANSGGQASAQYDDAFTAFINTSPTFDNTHTHSGSMAAKLSLPIGNTNTAGHGWLGLNGQPAQPFYLRFYYWTAVNPEVNIQLVRLLDPSGTFIGGIRLSTTGTLQAVKVGNSVIGSASATSIALSAWNRIEVRCIPSVGLNGEIQVRAWTTSPDSTGAPDIDVNNTAVNAFGGDQIDTVRVGVGTIITALTAQWDTWYDDFAANATDWIGPASTGTVNPLTLTAAVTTVPDYIATVNQTQSAAVAATGAFARLTAKALSAAVAVAATVTKARPLTLTAAVTATATAARQVGKPLTATATATATTARRTAKALTATVATTAAAVRSTFKITGTTNAAQFIQLVGTFNGSGTTTTTVVPVTAPTTVGNTMVLGFARGGVTSIVDSRGNTWTVNKTVTGTNTAATVASAPVTAGLLPGDTITITHGNNSGRATVVAEYAGLLTSGVDASATGTAVDNVGATTDTVTGAAATAQPLELVVAAFGFDNLATAGSFTAGGAYTLRSSQTTSGTVRSLAFEDVTTTTTGVQSASMSWTGTATNAAVIVPFKASSTTPVTTTANVFKARPLTLTAALTATATLSRSIGKLLTLAVTATAAVTRFVNHTFTAAVAATAALLKGAGKAFASGVSATAAVTKVRPVTLTAAIAATATLARLAGKPLAAAVAATATLARRVGKPLTAAVAATGTLARQTGKPLSAATTATATLTRKTLKTLAAATAATATVATQVFSGGVTNFLTLTASVTATAVRTLRVGHAASATVTATATLTRSASRTLTAAATTAAAATRRTARALTASTTATPTVVRQIGKQFLTPLWVDQFERTTSAGSVGSPDIGSGGTYALVTPADMSVDGHNMLFSNVTGTTDRLRLINVNHTDVVATWDFSLAGSTPVVGIPLFGFQCRQAGTSPDQGYFCRLTWTTGNNLQLAITSLTGGVATTLPGAANVTVVTGYVTGAIYRVEFRAIGNTFDTRFWNPMLQQRPAAATLSSTDTLYTNGGTTLTLRIVNPVGNTAGPVTLAIPFIEVDAPATATTTVNVFKLWSSTLAASVAATATLIRTAGKPLAAAVTTTGTLTKQAAKSLAAAATATATLARSTAKLLTAAVTAVAAATRRTARTLTASVTATATIAAIKVFLLTLVASVTATATRTLRVGKVLAPAVTATATVLKAARNTFTASVTAVTVLTRRAGKALSAAVTSSAVLSKARPFTLTAAVTATSTLARSSLKLLTASVTATATVARRTAKALAASVTPTATATRTTVKTWAASVAATATRTARYSHTYAAAVTATAVVTRRVGKSLAPAVAATVALPRSISSTLTATATATASASRSATRALVAACTSTAAATRRTGKLVVSSVATSATLGRAVRLTRAAAATATASISLIVTAIGIPAGGRYIYAKTARVARSALSGWRKP